MYIVKVKREVKKVNGFEIFLCVIAGIVLFFIGVLSVPVHIKLTYAEKVYLTVQYLFIKINILPQSEKKAAPKKEKPKKEEKPEEESSEEKPKEKKPNPLIAMIKANGHEGMIEILCNLGNILKIYGGKLFRSVIFDEIHLDMTIGTGDSARTAIKYGKTCQTVFPLFGFICSNNIVKKYHVNVEPDFLANTSNGEFYMDFHLVIRKIANASIAMAIRIVFNVVLKFLKGAKNNKTVSQNNPADTKTEKAI